MRTITIITTKCANCGEQFAKRKDGHHPPKFCSRRCNIDSQRKPMPGCKVCGAKLSVRSATYCRKHYFKSQEFKAHAKSMRVRHLIFCPCGKRFKHKLRRKFCSRRCPALLEMNKENMTRLQTTLDRDHMVERIKESPLTGRFETNKAARFFSLRAPNNVIYEGRNLSHFIRTHPELFDPADLVPYNSREPRCRATGGLLSLCPRRKVVQGTWKGWTWYGSATEVRKPIILHEATGE